MISKLFLKNDKYSGYHLDNNEYGIGGLSKVNVFIGQNNSGKSRFLRTVYVDEDFEFDLKQADFSKTVGFITRTHHEVRALLDRCGIQDADDIFQKIDILKKEISHFKINKVSENIKLINSLGEYYKSKTTIGGWTHKQNTGFTKNPNEILNEIRKIGLEIISFVDNSFSKDFDFRFERIYIPILKGLRPIQLNSSNEFKEQKDNYKLRTLRDYFKNKKLENNEIFTGLGLYEDTKALLLGNKDGRVKIKNFEEFLSKNFFEGNSITLIPDINNDSLLIGIGDDERPIYEYGDGIQMLIILLYPLFFNKDKNLRVFIEEPENSLHPGLQRLFLETLMKEEFKNFQYFITTHSNHFLDITLDLNNISIYTFNKKKINNSNEFSYHIENTSNDDINILDLIGARNASVFLSNCTIWVEGITDRLYLKKYLEVYQNYLFEQKEINAKFKEDFNFSFIEYGGSNIVHWSFTNELGWDKIQTSRLSSKIFVIADKDSSEENPTSEKATRLLQLKDKLGDRFKIVDGREIENTISEKILIETVMIIEKKNKNNVVYNADEVRIEKFKYQKLGNFIETNFGGIKRKYKADSGTIYCKLEFCKHLSAL